VPPFRGVWAQGEKDRHLPVTSSGPQSATAPRPTGDGLAYELPDGRLKLIDGHLRRDIDPDREVDVEVLDVNDDEARTLLLTIDPLAELAQQQEQLRQRLTELAPPMPPELEAAWQAAADEPR